MRTTPLPSFLLRLALAAGFLSAVASRLGFWGSRSSGWSGFLEYTASVITWAPRGTVPLFAVIATILESGLGILLLAGFKTRWAALGAAALTLAFALSMTYANGLKDPLDYGVFVYSAAAFFLYAQPIKNQTTP